MLARSRVATTPDAGRLGELLARPGMDPRVWVSLATVRAVHVESNGKFCDVTLIPSGDEETVRIGEEYAGNGFGDHNPLHVDDEVVVLFPGGEPDAGGVIVARLHNSSDKVPSAAVSNKDDRQIVVESGKNIRLTTQGTGDVLVTSGRKVTVTASDLIELTSGLAKAINLVPGLGSTVNVGGTSAVDAMIKGTTFHTAFTTLAPFITAWLTALTPIFAEWKAAAAIPDKWTPVALTQDALKTAHDALIAAGAGAAWPLFLGTMTLWLAQKGKVA